MVKRKAWLLNVIVFLTAAVAAFFVTRLVMTGLKKPGELRFADAVTSAQQELVEQALAEVKLTADLTVSVQELEQLDPNGLAYDILVPVADFYYPGGDITRSELYDSEDVALVSITTLTPTTKLLSLDGVYYLDSFTEGAEFITLFFDGADAEAAKAAVAQKLPALPNRSNTLSIAQTGVTALTRGLDARLAAVGDGAYFAANIADFLSSKDLTHISNEISFTDDCVVESSAMTLCADWRMLDAITAIGTDIVELTGNHNNDYGAAANVASIEKYHQLGLKTFGGGVDAAAAAEPLQLTPKNSQITWLGYNYSTTTATYGGATGDVAGANLYDEEQAVADITAAKARGDFVIVDVQFFECWAYPADGGEYPTCDEPISGTYQGEYYDQTEFFRHLIDLGADLVVGTSAHQPQTYELYQDKPIFYGLGNLFFDQISWAGTTRSLILTHYFVDGQYLQTRISPTAYDATYQTTLLTEEDSTWLLSRLSQARP